MALVASVMMILKVVGEAVSGDTLGVNPEKKPFCKGWHGCSKLDCVTEWFLAKKLYVTVSPTAAVMDSGSNLSWPPLPTVTTWSTPATSDARSERGRSDALEKRIVSKRISDEPTQSCLEWLAVGYRVYKGM